jgi:magnesium and cobalt transporter
VPEAGESLELQGHTFLIKEADVKQIQWVLVSRPTA